MGLTNVIKLSALATEYSESIKCSIERKFSGTPRIEPGADG